MGRRFPYARRIKIHRSYTVDEIARATGAHVHTVRSWIRKGMPTIDDRRPTLIKGASAVEFLSAARTSRKQALKSGEMYCLKCRSPKTPAHRMVDYVPLNDTSGNLRGICPDCERFICRRVSGAKLQAFRADLDITFPQAVERIRE